MVKPMFTASTNTHPLGYKEKSRTRYLTGTLENKNEIAFLLVTGL